jgi:hypothetical protein
VLFISPNNNSSEPLEVSVISNSKTTISSRSSNSSGSAKTSPSSHAGYEHIFFGLLQKNALSPLKEILALSPQLTPLLLTMSDEFNQNALLIAVKLNNPLMCEYLIGLGEKSGQLGFLEHCDTGGWSPLRYSSWMGYDCVVKVKDRSCSKRMSSVVDKTPHKSTLIRIRNNNKRKKGM